MNKNDDGLIIDELKSTGFPLEIQVMRELNKFGIKSNHTRYETTYDDTRTGYINKDLDILGIVKHENVENNDMKCLLQLILIGQVKKLDDIKICFYEHEDGATPIPFPNMLNECFYSDVYAAGHITLSEFKNIFGNIQFSKSIYCLDSKEYQNKKKYKRKETKINEAGGNQPVHGISKDLVDACEYFHKHSLHGFDLMINGCFPIIFTNAEIIKIIEKNYEISGLDRDRNCFVYLYYPTYLDRVKLTTRSMKNYVPEANYIPVLVTNFKKGLNDSIETIKSIGNRLHTELSEKMRNDPGIMREELQFYKDLR